MDIIALQHLLPLPGATPDFEGCLELIPALRLLAKTPQDPFYHAEGDVWTHTKMVVESLINSTPYAGATPAERFTLFYAALLHDISKPATTVIDEVTGKIGQPGHSRRGAIDTRLLLWRSGVSFEQRETICRIISVHQVPFFALKGDNSGKLTDYLINELSWQMPLWMLIAVARADMEGRSFVHKQGCLDDIDLFTLMAEEKSCLKLPSVFADNYTRARYFRGANVLPEYALYREKVGSQVTMMSGMPASGKDTWVRQNAKGLAVVSFDDAREELKLAHGKNEGMVAHKAFDMAKDLLRKGEPFVWNSTHLSAQMRKKTLDLLYAYDADVNIVYLEQSEKTVLSRNTCRDSSLNNKDLIKMLFKWEVPLPTEASTVSYQVNSSDKALKHQQAHGLSS
jgi:predicted kinase